MDSWHMTATGRHGVCKTIATLEVIHVYREEGGMDRYYLIEDF